MRRLACLLAAACLLALAPAASADPLLPPRGKVFSGLSGGRSIDRFQRETGNHPAVFGFFTKFGGSNEFIFRGAEQAGSRLMLHISTQDGYGTREVVTPRGIARGAGDRYLVGLNRRIAEHGQPTYIRLIAEMNQANNGYAAFDRSGRPRGPSHSTAAFKQAWRRATLILRGGPVAEIDAKLRRLGLPGVETAADELPQPQIAMVWVPQTRGTPDIPANMPRAYWPGDAYVDWVGTDFYSRFPNFHWLTTSTAASAAGPSCSANGRCGAGTPPASAPAVRLGRLPPPGAVLLFNLGCARRAVPAPPLPALEGRAAQGARAPPLLALALCRVRRAWTRPSSPAASRRRRRRPAAACGIFLPWYLHSTENPNAIVGRRP